MPEILNEMPSKRGKDTIYEWDAWLDGTPRAFRKGVDFDCEAPSFASQARAAASERGVKAKIRNPEDGVVALTALPLDTGDEPQAQTEDGPTA